MFRYIVIYISIFSILFLGATNIGPVSIRNLCIIGLIVYLAMNFKAVSLDLCGKLYAIYLAALLLCTIVSGQIFDIVFYKNFLTNHVSSLILVLVLPLIIKSDNDIKVIIGFITSLQLLNCFVSILQFYNIPMGWNLGLAINPGAISNLNDAEYYLADADKLLSRSIVFGITSFVVANGYYLATFLPIASNNLLRNDVDIKGKIISLIMLVISGIAIFMVQQRMAFFLLICYLILVLFIQIRKSLLYKLIFAIILIVIAGLYSGSFDYDLGRLTVEDLHSDSRMSQITNFLTFMNSNGFIWGADLNDKALLYSLGHNTLMDALRRGGFISFLLYLPLFIMVVYKCSCISINAFKLNAQYSFALSIACLLFIAYSFTHSTGLQSGSILFWIIYSLMVCSWKYEKDSVFD